MLIFGKHATPVTLIIFIILQTTLNIAANNVCTFRTDDKLFSLTYLHMANPYKIKLDNQSTIYFNFCFAFVPIECPQQPSAFSYLVVQEKLLQNQNSTPKYLCYPYSSNSTISLFETNYDKDQDGGVLQLNLFTTDLINIHNKSQQQQYKMTKIQIQCSKRQDFYVDQFELDNNFTQLKIQGNSKYGCPVLQIASLWQVLYKNKLLFGIILFLLGFYLLFFGRITIDITVFIAVFFLSFATICSILTLFISPTSETILIYTALLIILFASCMLAYLATKLIHISVFFVGAFLGFILGILAASIFEEIFNIYAVWPMIVFVLLFSIPLGLLTFKYYDEVIIASSAFTGAYLVVRPFSWILGGFPNQFLLYHSFNNNQITNLPWTFFVYLVVILIIAIVGAMYQQLKLNRQKTGQQIQINFVQSTIQSPIDAVKQYVDKMILKFKNQEEGQNSQYHQIQVKGQSKFKSQNQIINK